MSIEQENFPNAVDSYRHPFSSAEWWYFNIHLNNGANAIFIYYDHLGINRQRFSFKYNDSDGNYDSYHQKIEAPVSSSPAKYLDFGDHSVEKTDDKKYILSSSNKDFSAELIFEPHTERVSVPLRDPRMRWLIEIPEASVAGSITCRGTRIPVSGEGYHDHNWFYGFTFSHEHSKETLDKLLRGWHFGRLLGKHNSTIYGFNANEGAVIAFQDQKLVLIGTEPGIDLSLREYSTEMRKPFPSIYHISARDIHGNLMNLSFEEEKLLEEKLLVPATDTAPAGGYIRARNRGVLSINGLPEEVIGNNELWL